MLIENRANYYLKRTRASAKEIEFNVPIELRAKKDVNIDELFPLAIACIADLAAGIVRGEIKVEQVNSYSKELYFASKFYDSYLYVNASENISDNNYFYLVGAIAYYLCDQIGSSLVLANKINIQTLSLSDNKLDILLCAMLQNKNSIEAVHGDNELINHDIQQFICQYNTLMSRGVTLDYGWITKFKNDIYETGNYRDIFLIDALLAVFILKSNYSIFNMLPKHSPITSENLVSIIQSNHFVKEMWPSQRYMCELGLFNGVSGVLQMPTGAGKTKAVAIAIYSAFCANKKLSVVIAPFRALCREISDDLKRDLSFDKNILISEVSDLIQTDFIMEDLFNPERKTVVVTTPEKFLFIIRQDDSIIENIGQLIFDEGHLFDDEDRGATYELLIASILNKINPDTQRLLISAIISNVDEIKRWFVGEKGVSIKGNLISTVDKLPAVLRWEKLEKKHYGYLYYIDKENFDGFDFYVPRLIEIEPLEKRGRERNVKYFPSVDFSRNRMKEANDMAIASLLKIVDKDNVAIFCGRKDSANKILERIIFLYERNYDVSALLKKANLNEVVKIANLIEHNYGKDNPLYVAAKLGVFAHHRGVTDGIKNSVEYAIKYNHITNVVCTSTLAQGVNLPIKYLIISSIYQSNEQIKVRDFHNLIGRTARAGMFTEGTIVFSDPFVFQNSSNSWKWKNYKHLLRTENSEECSSNLLDIVRPKVLKDGEYYFYNAALSYYEDREVLATRAENFFKQHQATEVRDWYNHIIKTLGKLENYISIAIADNGNAYSDEFIDKMLKGTLAEALATDEEKENLRKLFNKICAYIVALLPEENDKRIFSKSLISSEEYKALQNQILNTDIKDLEDDALLDFLLKTIMIYGATYNLNKLENSSQVLEIAKMWMKGESYSNIQQKLLLNGCNILRRGNYSSIAIEDIVALCDGDFGYQSSLIINSICEILADKVESSESSTIIEKIQTISQNLKYGLCDQTAIWLYELGFNDRYIAMRIADIIGVCKKKSEVRLSIIRNREGVEKFLQQFPAVFMYRLDNL